MAGKLNKSNVSISIPNMLLTPPRIRDIMLGFLYICINTLIFTSIYFVVKQRSSNPEYQHANFVFISYGYYQSLIGFFAGLVLARITQTKGEEIQPIKEEPDEEELMLIDHLPV
jgi:hypothetical protein